EVEADVPAGHRETQRGLVALAEVLEYVEERVVPAALDVDEDLLELRDGLRRHHELVLQETLRTVGAVPLAEHVQRVVEGGQVLRLLPVGGALAVPDLGGEGEGLLVEQAVREQVGESQEGLAGEAERVLAQLLGQL